MKILNTDQQKISFILQQLRRVRSKSEDTESVVKKILTDVREDGDRALRNYTFKFDGYSSLKFRLTDAEIKAAYQKIDAKLLKALKQAKTNIEKFHKSQLRKKEKIIETMKGVQVWREFRAIEKVGLYVPGGKAAYPSTVLMLAVPAYVAGCREIILCTPADRLGRCNPAVLVAADLCGIKNIFKIGGAQAIAAMAYGTASIPKVSKIFGPGNQYVTTAKMMVYGEVDIDMPAGPSEVMVIADDSANPQFIAADLLSQLEHGEDSQAVLLSFSSAFALKVIRIMKEQMKKLSRQSIIEKSLKRSFAVVVSSVQEACVIANEYAPEHLEIVVRHESQILKKILNAGSVFLGPYSSEPLGDYATGANHTLPTSGFAKMFSPLSTESFGKMLQYQRVSAQGIKNLKRTVEVLADAEGLDAHKNAVTIRFY